MYLITTQLKDYGSESLAEPIKSIDCKIAKSDGSDLSKQKCFEAFKCSVCVIDLSFRLSYARTLIVFVEF